MLNRATPRLDRRPLPLAGSLCLLVALGAITALAQQAPGTPPPASQSVPEFMQWYQAQPRLGGQAFIAPAKVTIVKFTDLQCPACGLTYEAYKPVLAKYEAQYPGAVKFITRDYPLNKECNPLMVATIHEAACEAAIAVRLAQAHGRAAQLEQFFYANQQVLTPDTVRRAASLVGEVQPGEFAAGRARALEAVKADAALGRSIGLNSTPTFVINGVKVPKVMEPALFDAAIAYELRRASFVK